jgi:uncharacterized membrane protein (UPF0127 family)
MIVPTFAKYILRFIIAGIVFYGIFLTYKEETREVDIASVEVVGDSAVISSSTLPQTAHSEYKQQKISIGDTTFTVYVADTEALRTKGLSGWKELLPHEAMVFVFEKEGSYPFWMKDMAFNIDIVWLDASFKPVHIEKNVSPASYPTAFSSEVPAKYVVEVPAGTVDELKKAYSIK